jgi:hypothetical protein
MAPNTSLIVPPIMDFTPPSLLMIAKPMASYSFLTNKKVTWKRHF